MKDYILYQDRAIVKVPLSKIYYVTTHPTKAHAVLFVTAEGNFEASTSLAKNWRGKVQKNLLDAIENFLWINIK